MPLPLHLLPETAIHRRLSEVLLAGQTLPFTTAVSRVDARPIHLLAVLTGATVDATLHVVGELNAVAQTEDVTVIFGGSGVSRTPKAWTKVTSLSATGNGLVRVTAAFPDGQFAFSPAIVSSALRCRLGPIERSDQRLAAEGTIADGDMVLYTNDPVSVGDQIEVRGNVFGVLFTHLVYGLAPGGAHHSETRLERLRAL